MKILQNTIKAYEKTYINGYDKDYPSLELVRIEKIFFNKKGKVLDFGCGPGTNGIHLLKNGYNVTFCDISTTALKKVKKKLKLIKQKKSSFEILNLTKNKNFFSQNKNKYDYVICLSVLNNFQSKEIAKEYLEMFNKILKPKGKLIIDSNLSDQHNYKLINKKKRLYTTNPANDHKLKMFFPKKIEFVQLIKSKGFKINDIGLSNFKVFKSFEKEVIISATKILNYE